MQHISRIFGQKCRTTASPRTARRRLACVRTRTLRLLDTHTKGMCVRCADCNCTCQRVCCCCCADHIMIISFRKPHHILFSMRRCVLGAGVCSAYAEVRSFVGIMWTCEHDHTHIHTYMHSYAQPAHCVCDVGGGLSVVGCAFVYVSSFGHPARRSKLLHALALRPPARGENAQPSAIELGFHVGKHRGTARRHRPLSTSARRAASMGLAVRVCGLCDNCLFGVRVCARVHEKIPFNPSIDASAVLAHTQSWSCGY